LAISAFIPYRAGGVKWQQEEKLEVDDRFALCAVQLPRLEFGDAPALRAHLAALKMIGKSVCKRTMTLEAKIVGFSKTV
jgi:hypothetical protein